MTDGPQEKTEPWVKKLGVQYAYGYEHDHFAAQHDVNIYPYAMLIEPSGLVVWRGQPGDLDEKTLKSHLAGAISQPLFDWPASVADVAKHARAGDYRDALDRVREMKQAAPDDASLARWEGEVQKLITARVAGLTTILATGDYETAWREGSHLLGGLEGLPEEKTVETLLDGLTANEEAIVIQSAQREVRYLARTEVADKKTADEVIAKLQKLIAAHPKTVPAADAASRIAYLRKLIAAQVVK